MRLSVIGALRRDGKYKTEIHFQGGPNAFGGSYPGRSYTKLFSEDQLIQSVRQADTTQGVPRHIADAAAVRDALASQGEQA